MSQKVAALQSVAIVFFTTVQILLYDLPSYEVRAITGFLIAGLVFAPICFMEILNNYKYRGMINFDRIDDEIEP